MTARRQHHPWWFAVALTLLPVLWNLAAVLAAAPTSGPDTPYDGVDEVLAEQWRFLAAAAEYVPDGSSFTVRSETSGDEMNLFMMAGGLIPHARSVPSSYYGQPLPAVGAGADHVLVHGGRCEPRPGLALTAALEAGCVYRRTDQ